MSSGSQLVFKLETLSSSTTAGLLASWDGSVNHTWANVIDYGSLSGTYASNLFGIDTTSFANAYTGSFSIVQNGTAFDLQYTAIPEPSSFVLLGFGFGAICFLRRRNVRIS